MAIFKAVKSPSKKTGGARGLLNYVGEKAEKTLGINCSDDYKQAYKEFEETKEQFDKKTGRQYKHYVLSFEEEFTDKERVLELSKEFSEKAFENHEVFLAVHTDTNNLHCHIVVNSVNMETGKKHNQKLKDLYKYKELIDELGKEYEIEITKKSEKQIGDITTNTQAKRKAIENHSLEKPSDIVNTYLIVTKVLEKENIKSIEDFKEKLDKEGIILDWQPQRKNVTFEIKEEYASSKKRKFRLSNLEKTFNDTRLTKENLEKGFEYNKELDQEKQKELEKQREQEMKRKIYEKSRDDFDLGF